MTFHILYDSLQMEETDMSKEMKPLSKRKLGKIRKLYEEIRQKRVQLRTLQSECPHKEVQDYPSEPECLACGLLLPDRVQK